MPQTPPRCHWPQPAHRKSCKVELRAPSWWFHFPYFLETQLDLWKVSPILLSLCFFVGFIRITLTPHGVSWSLWEGGASIFVILRKGGGWWLEGPVGWGVGVIDLHRQREREREMRSNVYFFRFTEKGTWNFAGIRRKVSVGLGTSLTNQPCRQL